VQVLQSPKELERLISRLDEYGGDLEKLEALVQMPDSSLVSEVMGRGEIVAADLKAKEEAALEKDARLERVREAKETLKAALEKKREKDAVASKEEKEMLMKQLETKIKSSGVKPDQKGHVQDLLGELKERIREEHEVAPGLMPGEDIAEITNSLKELREAEKSVEKKHHGGRPERVEETGEAPAHGRHGKGPEDDIFKAVVGDVREQLSERKEGKAERGKKAREEPEGKRWYEKTLEAPMKEGPLGGGLGEEAGGENVELFEEGLDFGKATGELGLGEGLEGFGDVGELEDLGENVESSEFDGMFVDLGSAKGGCPNCGKKGTTIAYCSSCGKPLCSNCAKSVSGSDEFVKYTCPHCGEEFAMKKRMPA
jgi:predicted RNA-binding Zn-ribbon protein involved in translation (DUF1610 family)